MCGDAAVSTAASQPCENCVNKRNLSKNFVPQQSHRQTVLNQLIQLFITGCTHSLTLKSIHYTIYLCHMSVPTFFSAHIHRMLITMTT